MSSALVTLITLIIGLFLGLGLGIWISRIKNTAGSSQLLAQELNDVKVLLKASDERLKAAEEKYYRAQLEMAKEMNLPVQVHTPHRDKKKGTERSMAIALEHGLDPKMVIIDHNNEETVKSVLDQGFYAAFTIYPFTKMGNERMVEIVKEYGPTRIMVNSAADWGISDPLAIPKTAALMKIKGIDVETIRQVTYQNALDAFAQSGQINEGDFIHGLEIDQSQKFNGNTVLRGGQAPRINKNSMIIR
jgi:hypothetical protein